MRRTFGAAALVFLIGVGTAAAQDTWQVLFDGATLNGWKANLFPNSFAVVDGVIRARSVKDRVHLFYVGDGEEPIKFKDFELELVTRGDANSNSGIFFHADLTVRDNVMHLANGYEVQLNNKERDPRKTGSLYEVVDLGASPVDDLEWFTLNLLVSGNRITVRIDGEVVVDYLEPKNVLRPTHRVGRKLNPDGGAIALQAHDPDSTWYFKSIRVRRLN
jgi:hypothetical protein